MEPDQLHTDVCVARAPSTRLMDTARLVINQLYGNHVKYVEEKEH